MYALATKALIDGRWFFHGAWDNPKEGLGMKVGTHRLIVSQVAVSLAAVASGQVTELTLGSEFVVDVVHGAQVADGSQQVMAGLPATFIAQFDFSLPAGTQLPRGGLDATWRSVDPQGDPISVYQLELPDGSYAPRQWNMMPSESPAVTVLRYNEVLGEGAGRVDLPLGRIRDFELYPPLHKSQARIELLVGVAGELSVDAAGLQVDNAIFSASAEFATSVPEVVVDIFRPHSATGEPLGAAIVCRDVSPIDRVFGLSSTVDGVIEGLPSQVTVEANEWGCLVAYVPLQEGAYQIEVTEGASVVGCSTLATIDPDADLGYSYVDGGTAEAAAPGGGGIFGISFVDYETTLDESETSYPAFLPIAGGGVDMDTELEKYCKQPARPYTGRNAGDICGDCEHVPLSESDKPDCPEVLGLFWVHVCGSRYSLKYDGVPPTDCNEMTETATLNTFNWTGTRGEYTCASYELSFGEILVGSFSAGYAKSCCTYQATGESETYTYPSCVPN